MNNNVREVLGKLDWYAKTFTAIRRDEALTEGGRERQFVNLSQSFALYGSTVYQVFDTAWRELRSEFEALDRARRSASQRAEENWQYERVNYYSQQARSDIARSASLPELEKHLRSIVTNGSLEQRRAYMESGAAVLLRYQGESGAGGLTHWMEQEAAKLTRPAEFDKLDARERELVLQAVELRQNTTTASNMHPQSNAISLLKKVHVGMKWDDVSGNYQYTVDFADTAALTAPAAPAAV